MATLEQAIIVPTHVGSCTGLYDVHYMCRQRRDQKGQKKAVTVVLLSYSLSALRRK